MIETTQRPPRSDLIRLGMKKLIRERGKRIQRILKKCGIDKLKILTPKQRLVIELRAGLRDGTIYSMVEIAKMLNITRQGVYDFEKEAIRKMKQKTEEEEFLMW